MPKKIPTVGKGVGGRGKPPRTKFQLFYPEQERANAKALNAIQGIRENIRKATQMFAPSVHNSSSTRKTKLF